MIKAFVLHYFQKESKFVDLNYELLNPGYYQDIEVWSLINKIFPSFSDQSLIEFEKYAYYLIMEIDLYYLDLYCSFDYYYYYYYHCFDSEFGRS